MTATSPWLSTAQAAARLGVRPQTLYAYASRGVLHSHRSPDGRTSRWDPAQVELLARRGRPRAASRSRSLDIEIRTGITEIVEVGPVRAGAPSGHRIRYRGHDVVGLATAASFESVAELLWSGELPAEPPTWTGSVIPCAVIPAAVIPDAVIPDAGDLALGRRLRLVAAHVAATGTDSLQVEAVLAEARHLVATLAASLPPAGSGRCPRLVLDDGTAVSTTIAGRLWCGLSPERATAASLAVVNAALVLLADHEMAASTLAARVAASTRAGIHGVVAAGMGTLSGRLHGGESARTRRLLAGLDDAWGTAPTSTSPRGSSRAIVDAAIDEAIARWGRLPGFGQVLYPEGDPRAVVLLDLLRRLPAGAEMERADALVAGARRRGLPPPNVDFSLAVLGAVTRMPPDAGEVVFTCARIAGWVAHALEELGERPLRFRPRAVFVSADGVRSTSGRRDDESGARS
jgi:citrate synthase